MIRSVAFVDGRIRHNARHGYIRSGGEERGRWIPLAGQPRVGDHVDLRDTGSAEDMVGKPLSVADQDEAFVALRTTDGGGRDDIQATRPRVRGESHSRWLNEATLRQHQGRVSRVTRPDQGFEGTKERVISRNREREEEIDRRAHRIGKVWIRDLGQRHGPPQRIWPETGCRLGVIKGERRGSVVESVTFQRPCEIEPFVI